MLETPGAIDNMLQLSDGRMLGFAEYGHPSGPALFYFHGHPGSRHEARFLAATAANAGVRLIAPDRPGLGLSTYQPGRRLLDWPADVLSLANHLALDRFAVAGFSAGGPYALACAYRLSDRLSACGVISGVGQIGPFLSFLSKWVPWLMLPIARRFFRSEAQARQSLLGAARNWPAPDQQSLKLEGISDVMAASLVEALRPGASGAAHDGGLLDVRQWGFRPEAVELADLFWWHGGLDREVPVAGARAIAEKLPHCRFTGLPNEGHISVIVNQREAILHALMTPRR